MFKKHLQHRELGTIKKKMVHALIVEDQSTDIVAPYMLSNYLGFDVTLAFDGGQAFEEIKKMNFNLIIIDWNMPYMSGFELLYYMNNLVKNKSTYKQPKLIIYSGNQLSIELLSQFENLNIVDIWQKPMCSVDMLKSLNRLSKFF